MRTADVDLVKMGHTSIACGNSDILELDVHIVLGFNKLPTENLSGGEFEGADMTLSLIQQLYRNSNAAHSCDMMSVRKPEVVLEGQ